MKPESDIGFFEYRIGWDSAITLFAISLDPFPDDYFFNPYNPNTWMHEGFKDAYLAVKQANGNNEETPQLYFDGSHDKKT